MDICDDDEEEEKEDLRKKITKAKGELENLRYKELASENARGRTTINHGRINTNNINTQNVQINAM